MQKNIGNVYKDMDLRCDTFPFDDTVDPLSYKHAVSTCQAGDIAVIFTPDDTHFDIALECIHRGMHVMVTKPIVQTLKHHRILIKIMIKRIGIVTDTIQSPWSTCACPSHSL
mmetsp:Transcript_4864/g.6997  ORF Transcript_4864/g.6997 Transcript_4864/m.6997 type:complete len:112 (+) Transcript_4864:151-486(+)